MRNGLPILARTITAILCAASAVAAFNAQAQDGAQGEEQTEGDVTELSDISVDEDPLRGVSNEPSASSFGFTKPLLETPRTVSFVSEEQISRLNISSADDLTRVVPGVYTNRRWGLQGGVDVRGVSADMYFRGMKRLQMQGHARTSLTGMDAIEVIKGPPSPLYGMGRIGGYMNLTPKAGRAKTGAYLPEPQGFAQLIGGSWDRAEFSFGLGGPLKLSDEKPGGYYIYGLLEDTPETWVEQVHARQKILQGASSIDNFVGPFRLEFGGQYQNSNTAGAFMNRVTQDLIDDGTYIRGVPLVNLDLNGDGQVGFLETHRGSPVRGTISGTNQPLNQRFRWPTVNGQPAAFGAFPQAPGVPQAMLDYLNSTEGRRVANCRAADVMRAMPAGGPVPLSGMLPVGFALNPCTVSEVEVDPRRAVYEREQDAQLSLAFFDLVYDTNPDFTMKNQLFYDRLETFKNSQLPYGERQSIWAIEDKFTMTKRVSDSVLPDWLRANSLASVNYRVTSAYQASGGGDFDYRNDVMAGDGTLIPNASFWNNLENADPVTGAPKTTVDSSKYRETGVGVMLDLDLFTTTNIILGARYDWANAWSKQGYRFVQTACPTTPCTSASPVVGAYVGSTEADEDDSGESWSVSLSHQLPLGIRPYATFARSSSVLDGANNILSLDAVTAPGGFIGEAELTEVGIKNNWLGGKLQLTIAGYEQSRTDLSNNPNDPTASADITSTEARGVEAEVKWVPTRNVFISAYALYQEIEYIFATSANVEVTAQQLGFVDVLDPATGEVIFPAEAFLYGGRWQVSIPESLRGQYLTRNGNPDVQVGLNANWQITDRWGVNVGGNYFSSIPATRLTTVELPSAAIVNAGISYTTQNWNVQLSGNNLNDELYYRPRNGDTVSGLMSSMPGRSWALTIKHDFR